MKLPRTLALLHSTRLALGITQSQLASSIHYTSGQFISNFERGISTLPTPALFKAARTLSIPPSLLIETILLDQQANLLSIARKTLRAFGTKNPSRHTSPPGKPGKPKKESQ